uniref:DZIP3-like HEPN domain-containing protein n=1 Tax=Panagrolaimus superbus TaxID=310955 RepID=A0A914YSU1_9BILA
MSDSTVVQMDSDKQERIVNHCRILQLLEKGSTELHRIFRERWSNYHMLNGVVNEWNDDEESGKELVKLCPSAIQAFKDNLQHGKVDLWDITATNQAIQGVSKGIRNFGSQTDKKEDNAINALKDVRNNVHHGKSELSEEQFTKYWNKIVPILTDFGVKASEYENVKNMKFGQVEMNVDTKNTKPEFGRLKNKANELFKSEKYKEAIEVYDQILDLPGLLPNNQALIFSNRSATYLLLKDKLMAERDAEWAVQLWPCWWRGYYRLGRAQAAREQWSKAEDSLNKALALNSNKEVFHELSIVRTKKGISSRQEHLNPAQQPKSQEEDIEEVCSRLGISKEQSKKLMKVVMSSPKYGNIIRGHKYRDGIGGVEQDYAKAALYYGKAAADGEAEGMYNLGRLYHHGHGVPVDFKQSLYWLVKAAEAKPNTGTRTGSGVPEAQHLLGIKYSEGLGVKKDFRAAAEWYKKAIENAFGASANNLALLHMNGQGVEKSSQKGFEYHKLAAKWGDTAAMCNLASCYFSANGSGSAFPTKEDNAEGMKWLQIAASKGDLLAAQDLERRKKMTPDETMFESLQRLIFPGMSEESDPLDQDQYRKFVKEAAKKGSKIAQRHLDIWNNLNTSMNAFKKNDYEALVAALANAIRLDFQVVKIPEMFHRVINERIKTHPKDHDTITCYVRLNSKKSVNCNDDCWIYPKSLRFLYCRAIALCSLDDKTPRSLKALDDFLAIAPEDHDKVPACYYRKAFYYLRNDKIKFLEAYEAGLASEKKQLPCFLPYSFPRKDLLERVYLLEKDKQSGKKTTPTGNDLTAVILTFKIKTILEESQSNPSLNSILSNPLRKILIQKHRQAFVDLQKDYNDKKNTTLLQQTVKNLPNTPKPPRLISLKEITLKEMNPTADKVYDGYILEGRILEWSYLMTGIATIIEDKNGDVER